MTRPIHIFHLHQSFGNAIVLQDISLATQPGAFEPSLAPSGSRRSISQSNIARLERQNLGDVHIEDRLVNDIASRNLAMVAQSYVQYPFFDETGQLIL